MSPTDPPARSVDEFDVIARLLRPLTNGAPEALNLLDDAAVVATGAGEDLVISADMIVEGVHFLSTDPLDLVAQKLLRVNLSDLAAKGARPYAYVLTIAWPSRFGHAEREAFVLGLRHAQDAFGLILLGGDTTSTPGPLTASVTILGRTPQGGMVLRSGARVGDLVLVSGCIGDGWLGLQAALGKDEGLSAQARAAVIDRYRLPQPRMVMSELLRSRAHAAADVSDGLLADANHIATASGLAMDLDLDLMPLSPAGRDFVARSTDPIAARVALATGGDDYEIVLTAAAADLDLMVLEASRLKVPLTVIGKVVEGQGVRVLFGGAQIRVSNLGYQHS
ncbi:MAG TPA: thiamine-phosphate kinase [Caulobacteraceae bacterium]|nr:thiamine-phosphate kinase [Caulobacteraceae bacterium]